MKKLFGLFGMLLLFVAMQAQERTVNLNGGVALDLNTTKWYAYNGNTSDRLLATTRDTIDYIIQVKNQGSGPLHFYAAITLSPVSGADTTVAITVQQKKFSGESYSDIIASALTSAVSAEQINVKTTLGITTTQTNTVAAYNSVTAAATDYFNDEITTNTDTTIVAQRTMTNAAQTITSVANSVLYGRYIKFRLILKGNDSVGTGVNVKRIEIQFYN